MPVARAQVHQLSVLPAVDLPCGACDAGIEAVVEPHLDQVSAGALALDQAIDLRAGHARGLLHEHVRPRLQRPLGEPRELVVDGRHEDDVGARGEQLLHVRARRRAVLLGQPAGRPLVDVVARQQLVVWRERGRPLGSDQTAADDGRAQATHRYSLA